MVNIDFHIHTIQTKWDHQDTGEFNIDNCKKLIETNCLDAIAVTNHNSFDSEQYKMIHNEMCKQNILVFPGVEINIDKCHALIIFSELCVESKNFLSDINDYFKDKENIDVDTLISKLSKIENDKFIFIPHVFKSKRNFDLNNIKKLIKKGIKIFAIDCANQKQQLFALHNEEYKDFTPVCFSDEKLWEIKRDNEEFRYRNTTLLLDKKDTNWNSIYYSLEKKQIKQFNNDKEFDFWKTKEGEYSISLGLNIVLGKRGSGKTQTLKRIYESIIDDDENKNYHPWYVGQFEISEEAEEKRFYSELEDEGKKYKINSYAENIDKCINVLKDIDLSANEQTIDDDLIKIKAIPINNIWLECNVFSDMEFPSQNNDEIGEIVNSIQKILSSDLIAHITKKYDKNLKKLLAEIEKEWKMNKLYCELKEKINESWLKELKKEINKKTGQQIPEISQHTTQWLKNYLIVEKNKNFFDYISNKQLISTKISDKYNKEISFEKFQNQNSLENCINKKINKEIFEFYKKNDIYNFIREIFKKINNKSIIIDTIKQALFDVRVVIKNEFGNCNLSGGERAYVKLLEKFDNAKEYDFFIVDEIEQSFDNIFLWEEIIQQKIKPLVEKDKTIVISTHNSTIAMLSQPNKIIYCDHDVKNNEFKSYFGCLQSKEFETPDGKFKINSFETIINILESGEKQYKTKKTNYEKLKNANC